MGAVQRLSSEAQLAMTAKNGLISLVFVALYLCISCQPCQGDDDQQAKDLFKRETRKSFLSYFWPTYNRRAVEEEPYWWYYNKRAPGSEFLGKRAPGSEFLGKRVPGSEFLGKRVPRSEFLGKRVPGSEFLGKRTNIDNEEESKEYMSLDDDINASDVAKLVKRSPEIAGEDGVQSVRNAFEASLH